MSSLASGARLGKTSRPRGERIETLDTSRAVVLRRAPLDGNDDPARQVSYNQLRHAINDSIESALVAEERAAQKVEDHRAMPRV